MTNEIYFYSYLNPEEAGNLWLSLLLEEKKSYFLMMTVKKLCAVFRIWAMLCRARRLMKTSHLLLCHCQSWQLFWGFSVQWFAASESYSAPSEDHPSLKSTSPMWEQHSGKHIWRHRCVNTISQLMGKHYGNTLHKVLCRCGGKHVSA